MNGRYLLDTNIVIALFAGEETIQTFLARVDELFVPAIVIGELYYGAQNSGKREQNLARVASFSSQTTILPCTSDTARYYGEVKYFLKEKGRPIPENDIWIAALAQQHNLLLVTRDAHFNSIDSLSITHAQ